MSEEHLLNGPWNVTDETEIEPISQSSQEAPEEEYEEITSEEVDRVVAALDDLIQTVDSENIKWILEEAIDGVSDLLFDDEEEMGDDSVPSPEAA